MSNSIDLKRGLNVPIKGGADLKVVKTFIPDVVAVKPTDFKGFTPRLLVREGDKVMAGSPVMADKANPGILLTSPVKGTVKEIVRGAKRKLLAVLIASDEQQDWVDFGVKNVEGLSAEQIRQTIMESGLWPSIIQRPYGVVADPEVKPRDIFVSAFSTAPLAADSDFAFGDDFHAIQTAITALSKLTDGGVHVGINAATESSSPFHKLEGAIMHTFSGKHPTGNVGVQISNVSPILKGDVVWTVSLQMLSAIGKLFSTGRLNLTRKVAVTGPATVNPAYVETLPGFNMQLVSEFFDSSKGELRIISGDALTGENVGADGYAGFFDNQVTVLREGREREILGWAKVFRPKVYSASRAWFSWLTPSKRYDMDTNLHGGQRAFVVSDVYSNVLPMDIFPLYLIKACLAGDIDKMEQFGIYEVLPEDLAVCEYVDPSKNDIQDIIAKGIDLMLKEMV